MQRAEYRRRLWRAKRAKTPSGWIEKPFDASSKYRPLTTPSPDDTDYINKVSSLDDIPPLDDIRIMQEKPSDFTLLVQIGWLDWFTINYTVSSLLFDCATCHSFDKEF